MLVVSTPTRKNQGNSRSYRGVERGKGGGGVGGSRCHGKLAGMGVGRLRCHGISVCYLSLYVSFKCPVGIII